MTQRAMALKGVVTKEMEWVAKEEKVSSQWLLEQIASGRIVIPANPNHRGLRPVGIGEATEIRQQIILEALDGLAEESAQCTLLASNTLKEAITNYFDSKGNNPVKQRSEVPRSKAAGHPIL